MKKTLMMLAIAPLFSAVAFADDAPAKSQVPPVNNVAAILEADDETYVLVEGRVVKRITDDTYVFEDSTGTIVIELDEEDWPAGSLNDNSKVRLQGSVDRDASSVEIDVDTLEIIPE